MSEQATLEMVTAVQHAIDLSNNLLSLIEQLTEGGEEQHETITH